MEKGFAVAVLADTQIGLGADDDAHAQAAFRYVRDNAEDVALVIVCGDMVNAFPGDPTRPDEVARFKRAAEVLDGIKLLCVCGNHDVGNRPTKEGCAQYKREFGPLFWAYTLQNVSFIG